MAALHDRFANGNQKATPGCGCGYCTAVFNEWGEACAGFQRWLDRLSDQTLLDLFGLTRTAIER